MRPIDKGDYLETFSNYQDAQGVLIDRIGGNCSYCERFIPAGIHVEHKKPKDEYPQLRNEWTNFLLACLNCNSSKGSGELELTDYVWPDTENTLLAFRYEANGKIFPVIGFNQILDSKIENTWKLLGLNKHPDKSEAEFVSPSKKDSRWIQRSTEWDKAISKKGTLSKDDTTNLRECIVELALAKGMFSIWYTVFSDDENMKQRLINAFPKTALQCFDDSFNPIRRPSGIL